MIDAKNGVQEIDLDFSIADKPYDLRRVWSVIIGIGNVDLGIFKFCRKLFGRLASTVKIYVLTSHRIGSGYLRIIFSIVARPNCHGLAADYNCVGLMNEA